MSLRGGLFGRERERLALSGLLTDHPLVTLVGPGGVGKTSLATEASAELAGRYEGGVLLAELSGYGEADDIAAVVAAQVGFESVEALRLSRSTRPTLFVLDNCESALGQCRDVAAALVASGGAITVLATSRAPLRVYGERVVPLDPLDVRGDDDGDDPAASPAVQLFLQRAAQAGAPWPPTGEVLDDVATLVRRLDGLPLAIELAAARCRVLTPAQLLERMDRQLDVLTRPGEAGGGRHSSLRGAIEASYEPLPEDLQRFLRWLSAIPTSFDLGFAHGQDEGSSDELETLERLTALVDASLVQVRMDEGGEAAYRLLDSIRAFGLDRLEEAGEAAVAGERYCEVVLGFADRITASAMESFSEELLTAIRIRYVHLMAAIAWCVEHDEGPARAYRLFLPLYGPTGSRREVALLGERIRDRWSEPAPLRAEALAVMATTAFLGGEEELARQLATEAVEHPGGTALARMIGHRTLGFLASVDLDAPVAARHLESAIELAEGFSDAFARELRASWGAVVRDRERVGEVLAVLEATMAESASAGDRVSYLWASVAAAHQMVLAGDLDGAFGHARRAVEVCEDTGLPWSVATSQRLWASVLVLDGGWERARGHFRAAFESSLAVGDIEGTAVTVREAVGAAEYAGHADFAEALWLLLPGRGKSVIRSLFLDQEEAVARRLGLPVPRPVAQFVAECRDLLGPPRHEADPARPTGPSAPESVAEGPDATAGADAPRYAFGGVVVDLAMRTVTRDGEVEHVEPQVFDLLVLLIEHRGRVVPKTEILEEVWGDRFVSDSALTSRIRSARRATGDDGRTQAVIRTAHGTGYAFVAELHPA